MALVKWDPFRDLEEMSDRLNRIFARPAVWQGQGKEIMTVADWTPTVDISETEAEYVIKAELPEVRKEDVKVTVDENVITISGERRKEAEHKDEKLHRIESFYGRFSRSFRLPDDADINAIQAESRHGVLKVRVPKTPAPKPKTVEVQVN